MESVVHSEVLGTLYRQIVLNIFSSVAVYIQYCFVHNIAGKRAQECLRVHGGNGKAQLQIKGRNFFKG